MSAVNWATITAAITAWIRGVTGYDEDHVLWSYEAGNRPTAPYVVLTLSGIRPVAHDWTVRIDNVFSLPDATTTGVDVAGNRIDVTNTYQTGDGPVQLVTGGTLPTPLELEADYYVVALDSGHIRLCANFQDTGGNFPGNPITPIVLSDAGVGDFTIQTQPDTHRAGQELINRSQGIREVIVNVQVFAPEKSGILAMSTMTDIVSSLPLYAYDLDLAGVGVNDLGDVTSVESEVKMVEGHRGGILEPRASWDFIVYVASSLDQYINFIEKISVTVNETTTGFSQSVELDLTTQE